MNFKTLFFIGEGILFVSLIAMICGYKPSVFSVTFIIGIVIAGYAYTQIPEGEQISKTYEKANKNIQTLNDILWGKK